MANWRFEMLEYRQVLIRMRLGDTDRAIARAGLIGRRKAAALRRVAEAAGWRDAAIPLPEDVEPPPADPTGGEAVLDRCEF